MEPKYITHQKGETFVIYNSSLVETGSRFKKKLGLLCLTISFLAFIVFLSPILTAEFQYRVSQVSNPINPELSGFGQLLWLDKKGILSPADWDFSLIIPKIQINARVENSIDISNDGEYKLALKTGVAHAEGTSLPDQSGTIYIFGHSTDYPWNITRYSAYFYPLRYLEKGEEIIIIYQGKNYVYRVEEKRVAEANELEYLLSSEEENRLVLQTCWPPGTTWKRLIIVASPIEET
ncbi:sortase [Patescibacteria group bacterium]|nr:sortase [Patescibacteria group bacterium]